MTYRFGQKRVPGLSDNQQPVCHRLLIAMVKHPLPEETSVSAFGISRIGIDNLPQRLAIGQIISLTLRRGAHLASPDSSWRWLTQCSNISIIFWLYCVLRAAAKRCPMFPGLSAQKGALQK